MNDKVFCLLQVVNLVCEREKQKQVSGEKRRGWNRGSAGGRKLKETAEERRELVYRQPPASGAASCQHSLGQCSTNWWSIRLMGDLPAANSISPPSSVRASGDVKDDRRKIQSSYGDLLSFPPFKNVSSLPDDSPPRGTISNTCRPVLICDCSIAFSLMSVTWKMPHHKYELWHNPACSVWGINVCVFYGRESSTHSNQQTQREDNIVTNLTTHSATQRSKNRLKVQYYKCF